VQTFFPQMSYQLLFSTLTLLKYQRPQYNYCQISISFSPLSSLTAARSWLAARSVSQKKSPRNYGRESGEFEMKIGSWFHFGVGDLGNGVFSH
jgi:hypothetical protein